MPKLNKKTTEEPTTKRRQTGTPANSTSKVASRGKSSSDRMSKKDQGRRESRYPQPQKSKLPLMAAGGIALLALLSGVVFLVMGSKTPQDKIEIQPVVIKEDPKNEKKGIPLDLQKKIYKDIAVEYKNLQGVWDQEAEQRFPKPDNEDTYTGRDRRKSVHSHKNTLENNYKITKAKECKVRSSDIENILNEGFMKDWPK